ncbi:MAG: ice-binding family protein, partial [Gracilimonas sp.]
MKTYTISNVIQKATGLLGMSFVMALMLFSTAMAQPAVPELSAPADSAIGQPQNLTLSWNASAEATSYTLQVSEDENFSGMVFNESEISDTAQLVSDLDLNTAYYWRVSATNVDGTSDFSTQRIFTVWESAPTSPDSVNLGTAGNYVLLAKTAISTVPASAITGDVGISPAAGTYITGFNLTDATGYATSPQVTGKVYASDMASPTPSNLTTAVSDMETAFTDAAGRVTPDFVELHVGDLGGKTLIPGLYKWGNTVIAPASFEINGDENSIWIFQVAGDLTISSDIIVTLAGGAQAKNIFWQVSGEVSIGTNAHFEGIILSMTAINLNTGASLNGRALAQSAIKLDQNTITQPTFTQATSIDGPENSLPGE